MLRALVRFFASLEKKFSIDSSTLYSAAYMRDNYAEQMYRKHKRNYE